MAQNVANVSAGKPMASGGVYYAPLGTPVPTDATTPLAGFTALGYVSKDGLQSTNEASIEQIKAWGGDVVAAIQSEHTRSFEFTLLEVFSAAVSKFVFGEDNVTGEDGNLAILEKGEQLDQCVLVFDMKYGKKRMRIVTPIVQPAITGEGPFTDSELSSYTVQVECFKDTDGTKVYRYYSTEGATETVVDPEPTP